MQEEIRELLECYLKFMEIRQNTKEDDLSKSQYPSNGELGDRIFRMNSKFLNDPALDEAVKKMKAGFSKKRGFNFQIKSLRNPSICESQERLSINSYREDARSHSKSSLRDTYSHREGKSNVSVKKEPLKTIRLDYLFSSNTDRPKQFHTLDDTLPRKNIRDNIKIFAKKAPNRASFINAFEVPIKNKVASRL